MVRVKMMCAAIFLIFPDYVEIQLEAGVYCYLCAERNGLRKLYFVLCSYYSLDM